MPFARGNELGPAEKHAEKHAFFAVYFRTRRNRGKMYAGEKLTAEEICGESVVSAVYFLPARFSEGPPFMNSLLACHC